MIERLKELTTVSMTLILFGTFGITALIACVQLGPIGWLALAAIAASFVF